MAIRRIKPHPWPPFPRLMMMNNILTQHRSQGEKRISESRPSSLYPAADSRKCKLHCGVGNSQSSHPPRSYKTPRRPNSHSLSCFVTCDTTGTVDTNHLRRLSSQRPERPSRQMGISSHVNLSSAFLRPRSRSVASIVASVSRSRRGQPSLATKRGHQQSINRLEKIISFSLACLFTGNEHATSA